MTRPVLSRVLSRSPHGERGLKFRVSRWACRVAPRRSPHGERGLKLFGAQSQDLGCVVALLMESVD